MMESMLAFPAATDGLGNQPLAPTSWPTARKHFELTASIVDWEVAPGKVVQAWAYNGMVPGPRIDLEVGDTVEVADHQRAADRHRHPLARHRRPQRPGRRRPDHPGARRQRRDLHLPVHRHRAGDRDVPRPRPRRRGRAQRAVRHDLRRRRRRCRPGSTISGIEIPADLDVAQDIPMVLNDAGVIGLSLNGKSFPATAPDRRQRRRLGPGHLLQRGPAGPPDAPARLRADRLSPRTASRSTSPYAADTILIGPGRALHRAVPRRRRPAPGCGTATSSTTSSPTGHVRHGHRPGGPPSRLVTAATRSHRPRGPTISTSKIVAFTHDFRRPRESDRAGAPIRVGHRALQLP